MSSESPAQSSIGPIAPRIVECPNIEAYDLSSLRLMFTIARAEAVQEKTGVESHHIYGITEGMLMTTCPGDSARARYETLGWPTGIGEEARVLKIGSEEPVAPGETGEALLSRPAHATGLLQCAGDDGRRISPPAAFSAAGIWCARSASRIAIITSLRAV